MTPALHDIEQAIGGQVLAVAEISESKTNPRRTVRDHGFLELVESVREHGVLQPILVRPVSSDHWKTTKNKAALEQGALYEIVAGHRRIAAAREAGRSHVPAVVRELSDQQALEIQMIENLQRADLHPLEEAFGYQQLHELHKYDVARIAARIGRSPKYVYDRMKLLSLTKAARKLFLEDRITAGHAIILARLKPKDQERVLEPSEGYYDPHAALFVREESLFTPQEKEHEHEAEGKDPYYGMKCRSVRELQAWVDKHVRFDAAAADLPDLFPETYIALRGAKDEALRIVPITYEYVIPADARTDERVLTERSWERADGREGSKACAHSVLGVVVIGPDRGQAFRVCTAKEQCKVHWAAWQRERAKRKKEAPAAGGTAKERETSERKRREEERAAAEAKRKLREKAVPKLLEAVAAKIRKADATAAGPLAPIVSEALRSWEKPSPLIPPGKTAEDFVRHLAMTAIVMAARGGWGWEELAAKARKLGVDPKAILQELEPVQTSAKPEASGKKAGKAKPPRGQRPRKRGKVK